MNVKLLTGEILALLAWFFVIFSYWKNKDNKMLYLQIISVIFFSLSYFFLGAYTATLVCTFEIIRDYLYIKMDAKKVFVCTIPIYSIIGICTYDGFLSLLSIAASLNDGYALIYKERKVVFLALITYFLWLIYDVFYFSIPNIVAESVLLISNIIILERMKHSKCNSKIQM